MKKLKVAITGILVLPWLACGNAVAADINVDIVGIAESKGEVLVTLFNRTEG